LSRDGGGHAAGAAGGGSARVLRQVLERLAVAKQGLRAESEALRAVEARLLAPWWDVREPFMARRGQSLRSEATRRFGRALDGLHAILACLTAEDALPERPGPRSPRTRRLLAEIRQELRSMQRAFAGGSLLLAAALDAFGARR
jgi:hypothetical protein